LDIALSTIDISLARDPLNTMKNSLGESLNALRRAHSSQKAFALALASTSLAFKVVTLAF